MYLASYLRSLKDFARVTQLVFVREPDRKRPLGRPRCRREDNIKTDLQEMGCGGVKWIVLAECSRAQHRFPIRFISSFISSVCLLLRVTMVDKTRLSFAVC
jgi:hypothetical protein